LRDFRRPDLLADNPLMRSRLMSARDAHPSELQALLRETAASLFQSPRDQKLRRVLDLTYFEAELKQEAAAERLGVPFGTYRRHLTAAINRMARWLWAQEQEEPSAAVTMTRSRSLVPTLDRRAPRGMSKAAAATSTKSGASPAFPARFRTKFPRREVHRDK